VVKALAEVAEGQHHLDQVAAQVALDLLELQQAHPVEQAIHGHILVSLMLRVADMEVSLSYQ
jgi:hypothetical protein